MLEFQCNHVVKGIELAEHCLSFNLAHASACINLANMSLSLGCLEPAAELLNLSLKCTTEADAQKTLLQSLARICVLMNKQNDAVEIYQQGLRLFPDDPTATHMLVAVAETRVLEKPDERYVVELFDRFYSTL